MNQFIPFLDLKKSVQGQRQKLNEAWDRVLDSGHFVLGKELTTFEEKFAKAISSEWSLGCANGTDTLEIGLKALNIGPGDEVITTPLTAMPTLMGISATGATIRLADVNAHDGLISTKEILKTISSKTKAIVPVHLYGQICDMEEITSIAKKNNIKILEDCAQSFGAKRNGKSSGSWGDLASWSFYPTKNLGALGDGGALSGNTAELKNLVSYLRNYGQSKTYHHDFIGRNSRLDELQAAILSERLDFSQSELKARLNIANFYLTELKNKIKIISSNLITDSTYSCYHLFVISCPYNRDLFQQNLKEQGVGSLVHYPIPAHKQKAFSFLKYSLDDFPNANSLSQTVLSLPLNPYMSELEMKRVSDAVKKIV
ncbi:MAG: DegT/DnrJ/EryC1/StrS family aminotransferase [Deltaproteobacteria bacterium]|nr:DegT/DnrJ/EryC1/StrS family aminotransferase [Deltaproteobacteria bacterium]